MGAKSKEHRKRWAKRSAAAAAQPAPRAPVTSKKRKTSHVSAERDENVALQWIHSLNYPNAPCPIPFKLILGERSTTDRDASLLTWKCGGCGKLNLPRRCLVADIPVLQCECGQDANIEFDFSLANVKINDQSPITQENVKMQRKDDCTLCATTSNMEISLQMRSILSGEKLQTKGTIIDMVDLHKKYERARKLPNWNKEQKWGAQTIPMLAAIAKHYGVLSDEGKESKVHKLPEYVTVNNNFYDIVRVLADGYPLTTGIITGKNFKNLKPGQIYKAPREEKLIRGIKSRTGHAILLVGAGRRRATNYYHFINSWGKYFCVEEGDEGRYGFGMIRASDIRIQPVKFVRYEESIKYHRSLASTDPSYGKVEGASNPNTCQTRYEHKIESSTCGASPMCTSYNACTSWDLLNHPNPSMFKMAGLPPEHQEKASLPVQLLATDAHIPQKNDSMSFLKGVRGSRYMGGGTGIIDGFRRLFHRCTPPGSVPSSNQSSVGKDFSSSDIEVVEDLDLVGLRAIRFPKRKMPLPVESHKKSILEKEFFTEYGEASQYQIQEVIGKGTYGVVAAAVDTRIGERVAIKYIIDVFEHVSDATRILREVKLLRLLRHPGIVEIKHMMLPPSRREFQDIYVVLELMESGLHHVIRGNDDLAAEHYQFFLYQLLRALKYIHVAKVFHRDLKPKNILANSDCKLKICDFGLARVSFNDAPSARFWTYTPAVDIWSIGCIFAELLSGRPLFPGKNVVHKLDIITGLLGAPSSETLSLIRNEKARRYLSCMRKKTSCSLDSEIS